MTTASEQFDEEAAVAAGYHSRAFIQMFLGYLLAKLPQLRGERPAQLLDLFADFEAEMAAQPKSDPYPACPRCGCAPGTYGRLLRTAHGIICGDCQGHIFKSLHDVRAEESERAARVASGLDHPLAPWPKS